MHTLDYFWLAGMHIIIYIMVYDSRSSHALSTIHDGTVCTLVGLKQSTLCIVLLEYERSY